MQFGYMVFLLEYAIHLCSSWSLIRVGLDTLTIRSLPPSSLRWRAKVILLRIPVRDRPEVQLKAIAYGVLEQRRPNWGHDRKWLGNYLVQQVRNSLMITVLEPGNWFVKHKVLPHWFEEAVIMSIGVTLGLDPIDSLLQYL